MANQVEQRRRFSARTGTALTALSAIIVSALAACTGEPAELIRPTPAPLSGDTLVNPAFYELLVARDQNIVVILETSVIVDRSIWRIELALQSAISSQQGRCPPGSESCPNAAPEPDAQLYELAPEATLTDANLLEFKAFSSAMSGSGNWERTTGEPVIIPRLTPCGTTTDDLVPGTFQAASWIATDLQIATELGDTELGTTDSFTGAAYLNEFVIQFVTAEEASVAYGAIRKRAEGCDHSAGYTVYPPFSDYALAAASEWSVDEVIGLEFKYSG